MKIISWNVNGIRAVYKKNFLEWFREEDADIVCVQETKAHQDQIPKELTNIEGYHFFSAQAEKKGYSGTAVWTKKKPNVVESTLGLKRLDGEGRLVRVDFDEFVLFNVYFPNGGASEERLAFKMEYYVTFISKIKKLKAAGKKIIFCGDINTAHTEIDLAHPKENETTSGFLPEERAWIDAVINSGFVDTFRLFNHDSGQYSWWDYKTFSRDRNIGWRLDYVFADSALIPQIRSAFISSHVLGSDHCPVGIELSFAA